MFLRWNNFCLLGFKMTEKIIALDTIRGVFTEKNPILKGRFL